MRIAYLINQYPKVSHSFIRREINALERQGVAITRIAMRGWDDQLVDADDLIERKRTRYVLRNGPLALVVAVIRVLLTSPLRLSRALLQAWKMSRHAERPFPIHAIYLAEACRVLPWLRATRVQHVHAHFGTNAAEIAMLIHILGGPRWSFTVHGPEEFDKAPLLGLAEKVRQCAFVVAVSSYGRSQLYRLVDQAYWLKVHVVHCGLEPAFHTIDKAPIPTAPRLICVGRICEQKGHILLIEATAKLAALGVDIELVLAGDGEMRGAVELLIERHQLQSRVRITGWISSSEVRREIMAARALVLPSFAEGLPVVIMEAMALRRPIISTYVAGIPELVRPGEHGWLVPAGDFDALVEAMHACLKATAETLTSMGEAAHERVIARHDVNREATKFLAFLNAKRP
jgi:colanic acid/amylovoran biosynthesis glycosyltransferase